MKQGKFTYKNQVLAVDQFGPEDLQGRAIEREFIAQLLAVGAVITPIICTNFDEKLYVIDGRRRIVNCQAILELSDEELAELSICDEVKQKDFAKVTAKVFSGISPTDKAAWSLILNEQRKDNVIHAWTVMRELQEKGEWDEIAKIHKLNKQRFKTFENLNKLSDPDTWIEAFMEGKVAEGTLLAVAKLGGRQPFVEEVLKVKDKVTMRDVKEAKTASVNAVLAARPEFDLNVPTTPKTEIKEFFLVFNPETGKMAEIGDFHEMLGKKRELGKGYKLYKLVEVA